MANMKARWWQKFAPWWKGASRHLGTDGDLQAPAGPPWPVHARVLLCKSEQTLHARLVRAFPEHFIFAQVALSQLIGLNPGAPWSIRNRYSQLVADFVVCDFRYQPLAVIEVDGITHDHPKQAEADLRKAQVLGAARIVLLRLNGAALPSVEDLKRLLGEDIRTPLEGSRPARRWRRGTSRRGS